MIQRQLQKLELNSGRIWVFFGGEVLSLVNFLAGKFELELHIWKRRNFVGKLHCAAVTYLEHNIRYELLLYYDTDR